MPKRVFMIHGWEGYPEEGWRPWLKKELEKRGYNAYIPAMPDAKNPVMNKWVSYLVKIVKTPDKKTYFVGHSLGCITILRYIESLKEKQKIGGVILVAGFSHDLEYRGYKGELVSFFQTPLNWEEIKKRCHKFIIIHSIDDQWVPIKHAYLFKKQLKAKIIIQKGMKHYSGDDGITKLPVALENLLEISDGKRNTAKKHDYYLYTLNDKSD